MIDINGADQWETNGVRNRKDINGLRQGYWEICWVNNIALAKGNYLNGQCNGYWETYYSNGNLCYKANYANGKRNGYVEEYWSDGSIKRKEYHL